MNPDYWQGYHDCRADLRDLLEKTRRWGPEGQLNVIRSFLVEEDMLEMGESSPEC